jgi:hypothetical protein
MALVPDLGVVHGASQDTKSGFAAALVDDFALAGVVVGLGHFGIQPFGFVPGCFCLLHHGYSISNVLGFICDMGHIFG